MFGKRNYYYSISIFQRSLADVEYQEYISSQKSDISSVGYNLSQGSSTGLSSENSEASIRIEYSQRTRKKARTRMSRSHLKKHQNDPGRTLKCHNFRDAEKIGRTFVFALLYLALNEIGDDIQISDILRYIKESHLKYNNISSFLPANIDCSQAISDFRKSAIFCESHYRIREKASSIAKVIHMHKMKTPDLGKLCERFIKELCLPSALVHIIKNLIDFYPPEMKIRFKNAKTIPNFEGRAMAYIIFVLKLLFGLDGEREEKISNSAEKINSTLAEVDDNKTSGLFVWSEWVKYVEMRNIILSQCHYPTAMHLDPNASIHPDLYIDYLKKTNEDSAFRENFHKTEMDNIHIIFERLIQLHDNNSGTSVSFPPSTTPFSSYMEQILRNELIKMKINVPDFMYVDHERRDIKSYVNSKDLKEVFKKFDLNLRTNKIGYNKNVTFVPLPTNASNRNHDYVTFDFNISVEEWHESLDQKNVNSVEADLEKFSNQKQIEVAEHLDKMKREEDEPRIMANRRSSESPNGTKSLSFTQDHSTPPVFSIPSYQYFDEQEQDINDDFILSEPRRNLEETNSVLVDSSSDEETDAAFDVNENTIEFTVSNNDYWIFMENIRNMTNISFEEELRKLPSSFQWLLKQCALQLHMQVKDLYIELLAIENQFRYVLKPMHKMKNCIKYRDNKKLPPRLLTAVNNLRTIW